MIGQRYSPSSGISRMMLSSGVSKINIVSQASRTECLSLAPVSVLPKYQNQNIGTALIEQAHIVAKQYSYPAIVLIGHDQFYPRFGYKRASTFGVTFPFDSPDKNCMVLELIKGGLNGINGIIEYPPEFIG